MKPQHLLAAATLIASLVAGEARADFARCAQNPPTNGATSLNLAQVAERAVRDCAVASALGPQLKLHVERIATARASQRAAALSSALLAVQSLARPLGERADVDPVAVNAFIDALDCDRSRLAGDVSAERCPGEPAGPAVLAEGKWLPDFQEDADGVVFNSAFVRPLRDFRRFCPGASPGESSECDEAFVRFLPVLELHSLVWNQLVPATNDEPARQVAQRYADNHLGWKYYLADTGFQYPWELAINKAVHGGFDEIARNRPPPTSRWIVAHPTAGLYYSSELPDGSDADLIGVVKLVGYKRWSIDPASLRPRRVLGVSLATTLADLPGVDDVGLGIVLDYDALSLGYSKHGGTGVIMLNLDLAALLANRPQTVGGWLDLLADDDR